MTSHEALRLFLILTQEQVNEGNLPNNRSPYVNRAMGNIVPQMQAEFPEPPGYTRKTLVNKFKSLSCEWHKVKSLLRSGVEYDNESGMIYTSEDCWQDFIAKNPYLRAIRKKGFPFIDECRVLWPDQVSTGQYIVEASGANAIEITSDDEDEAEEVGVALGEPSRRQKRKQSNFDDPGDNPVADAAAPTVASSAEPVRRRLTRQGEERSHQFDKFGGRIERGINRLGEAISAPREIGSGDVDAASRDFQALFGHRVRASAASRIARYFGAHTLEAVAWLSIESIDEKEAFLAELQLNGLNVVLDD
ncbi:hypothetical protein COL154_013591 [Colletotrichum chrysophilum]|nr:hypothetical protein KNSL1_013681 [Colletotrichum chrysophilum]KAJ0349368.1 hypothetical protein COL154_013591 [Colletotrichum chrysophilum]